MNGGLKLFGEVIGIDGQLDHILTVQGLESLGAAAVVLGLRNGAGHDADVDVALGFRVSGLRRSLGFVAASVGGGKEEQKEARARMREEAKLAKEIEEERKKLEKEQQHYQNALERINAQLASASEADRTAIEEKKAELVAQLDKIDKEFKDVDYREANQRAGYVYVISNIGAFGENVYKIGMTRRLDPQDRVDELGDASVPFDFDVHAMIFSDDAPRLEAALHNAFADRKLNFVNQRREFFRVSLDEIKKVVKENYDRSVEFVELAPAEQYRESIKLREEAQKAKQSAQG